MITIYNSFIVFATVIMIVNYNRKTFIVQAKDLIYDEIINAGKNY